MVDIEYKIKNERVKGSLKRDNIGIYLKRVKTLFKGLVYIFILGFCLITLSVINYYRDTDINITEDYRLSKGFQTHLDAYINEADEYVFKDSYVDDKKDLKVSQEFLKDLSYGFDVRYIKYNYTGESKVIIKELDDKINNLVKKRDYLELVVSNDVLNNDYKKFVYQSEDKTIKVIDKTIDDLIEIKKGIKNLENVGKENKVLDKYQSYVKSIKKLNTINKTTYLYE